jgi:hypothetical protein
MVAIKLAFYSLLFLFLVTMVAGAALVAYIALVVLRRHRYGPEGTQAQSQWLEPLFFALQKPLQLQESLPGCKGGSGSRGTVTTRASGVVGRGIPGPGPQATSSPGPQAAEQRRERSPVFL